MKTNFADQFLSISEFWSPKTVASFNNSSIQIAKFKGEYRWHSHEYDEVFWVFKEEICIHFRDHEVKLSEGEICVVAHGVEHMTSASEEAHVVMIESKD